jgi:hypothetical protein
LNEINRLIVGDTQKKEIAFFIFKQFKRITCWSEDFNRILQDIFTVLGRLRRRTLRISKAVSGLFKSDAPIPLFILSTNKNKTESKENN